MDLSDFIKTVEERDDDWLHYEYQNSSNTSNFDIDFMSRHHILSSCYLAVLGAAMVLGNCGNILVILAVLIYKPLRTNGNMFIVNLALADLCVTGIVDPFSIIGVVSGPKFFKDKFVLCHLVASICLTSCTCSMWNIAAVAVNRYIVICKNRIFHRVFTTKKTLGYCVLLWIICVSLEMPNFIGWGGHTFDLKTMACSYDRLAHLSYTIFFCLIAIGIPLVTVFFCYISLFLFVRKTRKELTQIAGKNTKSFRGKEQRAQNEELQLAKTLFIVFCVFLVCWSPYAVIVLIDLDDNWSKIVYVVVIQMAHTNSSLNSVFYAATNARFRKGYKKTLNVVFCHICDRSKNEENYITSSSPPSNVSEKTVKTIA